VRAKSSQIHGVVEKDLSKPQLRILLVVQVVELKLRTTPTEQGLTNTTQHSTAKSIVRLKVTYVSQFRSSHKKNKSKQACQRSESFISPSFTPVPLPLSSLEELGHCKWGKCGKLFLPFTLLLRGTHTPRLSTPLRVGGFLSWASMGGFLSLSSYIPYG
jgi:hypothetical protein